MWYKCTGEQSRRRRKQCCLENRRQWNGDPKSPLSCPPPSAFNRRVHLCHFQWISTGRECSCSWRRRHVAKFIGGRSSKQRWRTKSKIIVVLIVTENKSQSDMQPDVLLCAAGIASSIQSSAFECLSPTLSAHFENKTQCVMFSESPQ